MAVEKLGAFLKLCFIKKITKPLASCLIFLSALGGLTVQGCAPFKPGGYLPPKAGEISTPQRHPHRLSVAPDQVERAINEAELRCDSSAQGKCPGNVAMLLLRDDGSTLSQCTGFLIGPQTLMTNSHCLPEKSRSAGASCKGITAVFPANGESKVEERIKCESVVFASRIAAEENTEIAIDLQHRNDPQLDVAIIQLSRPSERQPNEISRQGLTATETLLTWVVDPISDIVPGGVLRQKRCRPVLDTVLAPDFSSQRTNPYAQVAAFTDCEILHGNSGSPAFDNQGKVRAVVFATLPARLPESGSKTEACLNPTRSFKAMSLMSNLACVADNSDTSFTACDKTAHNQLQVDKNTRRTIERRMNSWLQHERATTTKGKLKFTLRATSVGELAGKNKTAEILNLIWSEPSCLLGVSKFSKGQPFQLRGLPIWKALFEVNELYQAQVSLLDLGQLKLTLTPLADEAQMRIQRQLSPSSFARFAGSLPGLNKEFESQQAPILTRCK